MIQYVTEDQIENRNMLTQYFTRHLTDTLQNVNNAFRFVRIETPMVVPHTDDNIRLSGQQSLRSDASKSVYAAAADLLSTGAKPRRKLPLVVWQTGTMFKLDSGNFQEWRTLEYYVMYSGSTATAYRPIIQDACTQMLAMCGVRKENDGSSVLRSGRTGQSLVAITNPLPFWGGSRIELNFDLNACIRAFSETAE